MTDAGIALHSTIDATTTGVEQNQQVVRDFFAAMNAGDVDAAFKLLAADCGWFSLSTRKVTPKEEMRAAITWVNDTVLQAPIVQTVLGLTAQDDRVAAETVGHGCTRDGVVYDNAYHFLFRVTGGLITEIREYMDTYLARKVFARGAGGELDRS